MARLWLTRLTALDGKGRGSLLGAAMSVNVRGVAFVLQGRVREGVREDRGGSKTCRCEIGSSPWMCFECLEL